MCTSMTFATVSFAAKKMADGKRLAELLEESLEIFVYDEVVVQDLKNQWEGDKASGAETELASRLSYASALSRSPKFMERAEAIDMLTDSLWECEEGSLRAEVLKQLCIAHYSKEDFEMARRWGGELLGM